MTKSILDEKCECGRKIDYFGLKAKYMNETKPEYKRQLFISYILILISTITIIFGFISYVFIKPETTDLIKGFVFGALITIIFIEIQVINKGKNNIKPYNSKQERQKHIKKLKFYQSMKNKNHKKIYISFIFLIILIFISMLYTGITIIKYVLYDVLNFTQNDPLEIIIIVGLMFIIYIILDRIEKLIKKGGK